jgi:PAS domain-containing protein
LSNEDNSADMAPASSEQKLRLVVETIPALVSEYTLHQIIDTVPGLIWSTDHDGEPSHVSQRLFDYSGLRFEEFKHVG